MKEGYEAINTEIVSPSNDHEPDFLNYRGESKTQMPSPLSPVSDDLEAVESSPIVKPNNQLKTPMQRLRESIFKVEFINVILMSVGFLCTMSGYGASQGLMTSIHKEMGFYCLATLYGVFAVTNFIAPSLSELLGPKYVLPNQN